MLQVMENWVERIALRNQHLANAEDLWQSARTAIDNCCNSYRQHFAGTAQVTNQAENGHRIVVAIHFHLTGWGRHVSIEFGRDAKNAIGITVTVDDKPAKLFQILADADHAFISFQDKEISADEFSRLALEDALFKSPEPRKSKGRPAHTGEWS